MYRRSKFLNASIIVAVLMVVAPLSLAATPKPASSVNSPAANPGGGIQVAVGQLQKQLQDVASSIPRQLQVQSIVNQKALASLQKQTQDQISVLQSQIKQVQSELVSQIAQVQKEVQQEALIK